MTRLEQPRTSSGFVGINATVEGRGLNPARIVVAIPCLDEGLTIAKVVAEFKAELPESAVVVVDNGSSDDTVENAKASGAIVIREKRHGKGYAVQTIFSKIDADVYVLVDGDDTYPASQVHKLLKSLAAGDADMVVAERLSGSSPATLTRLHQFGNHLIRWVVGVCFGTAPIDILSGFRAISRDVVDHVPLISRGFEIETELTIHALEYGFRIKEVPILYKSRPAGSFSKLRSFRDGYRILLTIAILLRDHRPLLFFSSIVSLMIVGAIALAGMALTHYRLQSPAITSVEGLGAMGLAIVAVVVFIGGLIVNAVNTRARELQNLVKARERVDSHRWS